MREYLMKKILMIISVILCFAYVFTGCEIPDDGRGYQMKCIGDMLSSMTTTAWVDFTNAEIECFDENGDKIPHTVEEYKKLYHLSEDNLIGYFRMLHEDREETEKLIRVLGYESWDDFLVQKGHLNKNGEPDIKVWQESVYVRLQKEYDEKGKKTP